MKRSVLISLAIVMGAMIVLLPGATKMMAILPFGLALNGDKTKTTKTPVDVFIAIRSSESTPVTMMSLAEAQSGGNATWTCIGTMNQGFPDWLIESMSQADQGGRPVQTGVDVKVTIEAVETTYTQLQARDGFVNQLIDMVCVEQGGTTGHRIQKTGLTHGLSGKFTNKEALKSNIQIMRYADKVTTAYDQVTLS